MLAQVTEQNFQWFLQWLQDSGYIVTGVAILSAGKYDKLTYEINYDIRTAKESSDA